MIEYFGTPCEEEELEPLWMDDLTEEELETLKKKNSDLERYQGY